MVDETKLENVKMADPNIGRPKYTLNSLLAMQKSLRTRLAQLTTS